MNRKAMLTLPILVLALSALPMPGAGAANTAAPPRMPGRTAPPVLERLERVLQPVSNRHEVAEFRSGSVATRIEYGVQVIPGGNFTRIQFQTPFASPPSVTCTVVDGGKGTVVAVLNPYPTTSSFEVGLNGGWTLPVHWVAVGR